jgi:hypothetical protein
MLGSYQSLKTELDFAREKSCGPLFEERSHRVGLFPTP